MPQQMLSAHEIVANHDYWTRTWHDDSLRGEEPSEAGVLAIATRQHRANFELWHTEDEARTPGASDAVIAGVKRRIDRTNQLRNDLAEQIDEMLLDDLGRRALPNPAAPLNSESPGLMIDRLSILALKIYHTQEEIHRADAAEEHRERNETRLRILVDQREDLAACLDALWAETLAGTRRFKIYRQLKMYNDPQLNPAIYRKQAN